MNTSPNVTAYIESLWKLIYSHLRSRGCEHHEAEDLAQEVFRRLAAKNLIDWIESGATGNDELKIRNYVFVVARNLRCNMLERSAALKRGSQNTHLSIDDEDVAKRFHPKTETTPALEAEWHEVRQHWEQQLTALENVTARRGQAELFQSVRNSLDPNHGHGDYRQAAESLGLNPRNVRVQANTWRRFLLARVRSTLESERAA